MILQVKIYKNVESLFSYYFVLKSASVVNWDHSRIFIPIFSLNFGQIPQIP